MASNAENDSIWWRHHGVTIHYYSLHEPGWLLKWLNLITAHGSVSNEPGSVTYTSSQVFENCQLGKSHWKINQIVTTEYIILGWNPQFIFIFHYFNAKLFGKYYQTPVWQLCVSCQILDLTNFQNNLTWPNSNTAGISLDSRLKYSKVTHRLVLI